jgi:hypothetical protein
MKILKYLGCMLSSHWSTVGEKKEKKRKKKSKVSTSVFFFPTFFYAAEVAIIHEIV